MLMLLRTRNTGFLDPVATGWIVSLAPSALPVDIDDDVREEYWLQIRKKPGCLSRETT
jgi:hypothetical protein